jgi:hypothetical protein
MTDEPDWAELKAKRLAIRQNLLDLQQGEKAAMKAAADYLESEEAKSFLARLEEFESISQLDSPFIERLVACRYAIERLQAHAQSSNQILAMHAAMPVMTPALPPA